MKKHCSLFQFTFFFFATVFNAIAQPAIQWQKSLGGTFDEHASCIQQTSDGGYILAGSSNSNDGDVTANHGGDDFWIVKLDSAGKIQWQKCLGGSNREDASSIQQSSDGGYIVAGITCSNNDGDVSGHHGDIFHWDYWIVKLDSIGNLQWQKALGGTGNDVAYSIQRTTDSGYIVAGSSNSNDGDVSGHHGSLDSLDCWVVKLNSYGNIQWQRSLGGTSIDEAWSIQQTTDSGYIVAGYSGSNDGDVTGHHGDVLRSDYWIIKLSISGNILWQRSLGGTNYDRAVSIQQTTDGGFIVAGESNSNDGDVTGHHGDTRYFDYWIVKLDSTGILQWQKSLGGSGIDWASSTKQTADGGYIVVGTSPSNDGDVSGNQGNNDYWIVKLDSSGNIEWQKSLGGTTNDAACSVQQTNDSGYVICGESASNDGDVTGNHGGWDFWMVKLSPYAGKNSNSLTGFEIFPNPIGNKFRIQSSGMKIGEIEIFNALGEKIYSESFNGVSATLIAAWPAGIYFVELKTESSVAVKKLVKE